MEDIRGQLGRGRFGEEALQLWREYAADETPEARFVKDIDKLELIIQAVEYEQCTQW